MIRHLVREGLESIYDSSKDLNDMTLAEYRHYKFTDRMLKNVSQMFQMMEIKVPDLHVATRFLHESNHIGKAFWWNLLNGILLVGLS
jgi:hypothetical protein